MKWSAPFARGCGGSKNEDNSSFHIAPAYSTCHPTTVCLLTVCTVAAVHFREVRFLRRALRVRTAPKLALIESTACSLCGAPVTRAAFAEPALSSQSTFRPKDLWSCLEDLSVSHSLHTVTYTSVSEGVATFSNVSVVSNGAGLQRCYSLRLKNIPERHESAIRRHAPYVGKHRIRTIPLVAVPFEEPFCYAGRLERQCNTVL